MKILLTFYIKGLQQPTLHSFLDLCTCNKFVSSFLVYHVCDYLLHVLCLNVILCATLVVEHCMKPSMIRGCQQGYVHMEMKGGFGMHPQHLQSALQLPHLKKISVLQA